MAIRHSIVNATRCVLVAVVALSTATATAAEGIFVRTATLETTEDGYQLSADFAVELGPTLEDALQHGVPLYFALEFKLWRPRRWWFAEKITDVEQSRKLSYNALTRQYRVSIGPLHQNFNSLYDAVGWLGQVRGAPSVDSHAVTKGTNYVASVQMRLDVSQLPKPFQVKAVTSPEWKLSSDEFSWDVAL